MKKTLILSAVTAASLMVGVQYASANAMLLPAGTSPTSIVGDTVTAGGTQVGPTLVSPLSGADSGTLTSWIYSGFPSSLGGYTFVYQVNLTAGDYNHIALNGFGAGTVAVGYEAGTGTYSPNLVDRNTSGSPIDFYFSGGSDITSGTTVDFVVATTITSYTTAVELLQDNVQGQGVGYAPNVPDGGTTMVMLGGAFCVLGAIRRKLA